MWWLFKRKKKKYLVNDFHDISWYELAERRFGKRDGKKEEE